MNKPSLDLQTSSAIYLTMDLTHLLKSSTATSCPDDGLEDSANDRGKMFKRKGINFSTTTSEGRILRSAQVNSFKSTVYTEKK